MSPDNKHGVVGTGLHIFQLHRCRQQGLHLLEIRLLSGNIARVIVVHAQRQAEGIHGRRDAAGGGEGHFQPRAGENLVRLDELFGPEPGGVRCPVLHGPDFSARKHH